MSIHLIAKSCHQGGMTAHGPMHKIGLLGAVRAQTAPGVGTNNMVKPYNADNTHLGGRRGAGFLSNLLALPSRLIGNIGLGKEGGKKGKLNPGLQAYLDAKRAKHGGMVPMPGGRKGKLNPGLQAYLDAKRKQKGGMSGPVPMPGGRRRRHSKKAQLAKLLEHHAEGGRVPMPGGSKRRGGFWGMLAASLLPTLLNKAIPDAQGASKRRRKAGTAGIYYG